MATKKSQHASGGESKRREEKQGLESAGENNIQMSSGQRAKKYNRMGPTIARLESIISAYLFVLEEIEVILFTN